MQFTTTPEKCFINAPYNDLENGLLELFLNHGLQPEIGLEGNALYDRTKADFAKIAKKLHENGLACTLHAPFFDLSPGALDPEILKVSRNKLRMAFDLIEIFKPAAIICHLNFEDNKHAYKSEAWYGHALGTWQELLDIAIRGKTRLVLENTYETNHEQHLKMLKGLNSSEAGFCLDVGHLMAFANSPWQDWLPAMNKWLKHLHLHDNHGGIDTHIGIGLGSFAFQEFFSYLARQNLSPLITLEPHSEEDLWVSLDALASMGVVRLGKNN